MSTTATAPSVVNGGLIDFMENSQAALQNQMFQAAMYNQAQAQAQAAAAAAATQAQAPLAPFYPTQQAFQTPIQPYSPVPGTVQAYPGQMTAQGYQLPGQVQGYPASPPVATLPFTAPAPAAPAATQGVVQGPPSFIQINGTKYEPSATTNDQAHNRAVERSAADIERRVSQRVNEFMAKRDGGLAARPASRQASSRNDDMQRQLRQLNAEMSRTLTRTNKAR